MARHAISAGVFTEAAVLYVLMTGTGAAEEAAHPTPKVRPRIELLHNDTLATGRSIITTPTGGSRHRFYVELDGARAQAEDWLHDAGFSLLEERDGEGRRSYSVLSGALIADWPSIRLRARIGLPQLSVGLRLRPQTPALGITVPWHAYTVEVEGLQDQSHGYMFMGALRWSAARQRIQCGVAVPVALRNGPSVGILLQLRMRFGD